MEASQAGDSEEEMPTLTPSAKAFSKIPADSWEVSFSAISNNSSLLSEKTVDALLLEAFNAGMRNDLEYLRQCVHQGLLLQYCGKLGPDGVNLFFKRLALLPFGLP
jgi:cell division cycle protein 37